MSTLTYKIFFHQDLDIFSESIDAQSQKPAYFRNIGKSIWAKFVDKQIEGVLSKPYPKLDFVIATGIHYNNIDNVKQQKNYRPTAHFVQRNT